MRLTKLESDTNDMFKIALLDDDKDLVELLVLVLTEEGYSVLPVASDGKATEIIETYCPHLIVLDEWLLRGRGSHYCSILKKSQLTKSVPVLMYSTLPHLANIAAACEADVYLEKPFDLGKLLALIAGLLENK